MVASRAMHAVSSAGHDGSAQQCRRPRSGVAEQLRRFPPQTPPIGCRRRAAHSRLILQEFIFYFSLALPVTSRQLQECRLSPATSMPVMGLRSLLMMALARLRRLRGCGKRFPATRGSSFDDSRVIFFQSIDALLGQRCRCATLHSLPPPISARFCRHAAVDARIGHDAFSSASPAI